VDGCDVDSSARIHENQYWLSPLLRHDVRVWLAKGT